MFDVLRKCLRLYMQCEKVFCSHLHRVVVWLLTSCYGTEHSVVDGQFDIVFLSSSSRRLLPRQLAM